MAIMTKADYSRSVLVRNRETRVPIPLDGWALEMVVRERRDSSSALLTVTTVDGGLKLEPGKPGLFTISLTAAQTSAIGAGDRPFAIYRIDGGMRVRILSGRMIVREGI